MSSPSEESSSAPRVQMLVVKVASRCNLNCSYCYVYNLGDTTWKRQPKVMSREVVGTLLQRVRGHCLRHGVKSFLFIFHGGEPLLAGPEFYSHFVEEARRILLPEVTPVFTLQTNGTLLTDEWCELLASLKIRIGISLDGPKEINDKHRVDHAGKGSYDATRRGIDTVLASPHVRIPLSILSVINIESDPIAVYEHLKEVGAKTVDFLLPEATHDRPYPGWGKSEAPYADWLIAIFDRWFHEKPVPMRIRLFQEIMTDLLGGQSKLDTFGSSKNEVLVIETDGGIEPVGSLSICGDGFTKLGASVRTHEFEEALSTRLAQDYYLSGQSLSGTCQQCPVHEVCAGGYLPHRFSQKNGFDNPSVYCKDLMKLITHIQNKVLEQLPAAARTRLSLTPLSYENAKAALERNLMRSFTLPEQRAANS
ncbi:radical SAM protein [Cystobacter fuscus]|uniref:radical SAM protein n=1 Tax=Cystobacter fuscus TaxID=43 RepID=UPI0037BE928B